MYVVKRTDGTKKLNIVVETNMSRINRCFAAWKLQKSRARRNFFSQLELDGYTVSFQTQFRNKKVKQIIEDVTAV